MFADYKQINTMNTLINVQQLTQKVIQAARKRKRKHTNLYSRLNNLLRGGVWSVDAAVVEDTIAVLEAEHKETMTFLHNAHKELLAEDKAAA